ncbi:helix-turn-helix domain-containing protein [uncultured Croceitalea sp.]|uniref:helix-turn-helix domain-containing protein n=1 Tax=uncultured Croceitalea sp. TaxID=1798908 RepID=UPI003305A093
MIHKSLIADNDLLTITKATYREGCYMPNHSHDNTAISFVLKGFVNETVNNNEALGGIANIIIKPANTIHKNVYATDSTIICVYINAENELKQNVQDELKEWNWLHPIGNYFFLEKILTSQDKKEQLNSLNEFIGYCSNKKNEVAKYKYPPEWLLDLKTILDTSYNESLKSKDLAKHFNLHPVYMTRVFKKYYGQSVKSYVNILRVNGAMASIMKDEDKLAHIAIDNGYTDQSHLNRKFRSMTQLTPRQFHFFTN